LDRLSSYFQKLISSRVTIKVGSLITLFVEHVVFIITRALLAVIDHTRPTVVVKLIPVYEVSVIFRVCH